MFRHNVYPSRSILLPIVSQASYTICRENLVVDPTQITAHYCSYFEWLHTTHTTTEERIHHFQRDFNEFGWLVKHMQVILHFLHTGYIENVLVEEREVLLDMARKLGCPELIRMWSKEESDIYMITWHDWIVQEQEKALYHVAFSNELHPLCSEEGVDPAFLYYQQEWQRIDTSKFASIVLQNTLFYALHLQTGLQLKWTKTQSINWNEIDIQAKAQYGILAPCETKEEEEKEEEEKQMVQTTQKNFTLADWLLSLKNIPLWKNTFAYGGNEHPQQKTRDNVVIWSTSDVSLSELVLRIQVSLRQHNIHFVEYDDSKTDARILLCERAFARIEVRSAKQKPMRSLLDYFARQTIDMDAVVYDIYHGLWVSSARGMIAWKFNANRVHRLQKLQDEHRIGLYQAQRERDSFTRMPGFIRERCPHWQYLCSQQVVAYGDLQNLHNRPFQLLDLLMPKFITVDASTSSQPISREQMLFWKEQQDYYHSCCIKHTIQNNMYALLYEL